MKYSWYTSVSSKARPRINNLPSYLQRDDREMTKWEATVNGMTMTHRPTVKGPWQQGRRFGLSFSKDTNV